MKNIITYLFISIFLVVLGVFLTGVNSLTITILGYALVLWGAGTGWGSLQKLLSAWRILRLRKNDPEAFAKMINDYEAASEAVRAEEEEKYENTQVAIAMIQEFEGEVKILTEQYPYKSQQEIEEIAAGNVKRRNPDHYPVESQ
jgi:hypothetical protein